jgi:CRP/FNR family transcriptional regulator, cyclic AMP receptor protein
MADLFESLRQVQLLESLTDRELADVVGMGQEATFPAGADVVTEGRTGAGFHLILEGTARVTVRGEERRTLVSGEYFGEMALFDNEPRSATVSAVTDLRTWSLASWDFMGLVETEPKIARKLFAALSKRIRALQGDAG